VLFDDLNGAEIVDMMVFQIPAPIGMAGYTMAPKQIQGNDPLDDIVEDPTHYRTLSM